MVRFCQSNSTDLDGHSLNWQSIAIGLILILRILQLLLLLLLLLLSWFVAGGGGDFLLWLQFGVQLGEGHKLEL